MAKKRQKTTFDNLNGLQFFPMFEEELRGNEERRIAKIYSNLPYFPTPKNDNEKLLNLQCEYRKSKNKRALAKIQQIGFDVAMKFIQTEAKKNKKVRHLDFEDKAEKAMNAINYIIIAYANYPDFVIKKSFTAYLYLRVKQELYYHTKAEEIVKFCDGEKISKIIDKRAKTTGDFTESLLNALESDDESKKNAYYAQF